VCGGGLGLRLQHRNNAFFWGLLACIWTVVKPQDRLLLGLQCQPDLCPELSEYKRSLVEFPAPDLWVRGAAAQMLGGAVACYTANCCFALSSLGTTLAWGMGRYSCYPRCAESALASSAKMLYDENTCSHCGV